jgi:hypothetical protein
MRMWMIEPHLLCRQHLLGEHYELHMLVGSLRKGRRIDGYLLRRFIDPSSIYTRHAALEKEIRSRGGNPQSPLNEKECRAFAEWYGANPIDPGESMSALSSRCEACRNRIGSFVRVMLTRAVQPSFIPW